MPPPNLEDFQLTELFLIQNESFHIVYYLNK